ASGVSMPCSLKSIGCRPRRSVENEDRRDEPLSRQASRCVSTACAKCSLPNRLRRKNVGPDGEGHRASWGYVRHTCICHAWHIQTYVRFLDMPSKRSKFSEMANFLHAFTWDNQEPLKRPKTNQKP